LVKNLSLINFLIWVDGTEREREREREKLGMSERTRTTERGGSDERKKLASPRG